MLAQQVAISEALTLAAAFVAQPIVVRQLGGERDANFLVCDAEGHRYVLKVSAPDVTAEEISFEADVLDRLARANPSLPVPRTVRAGGSTTVDAGSGQQARMVTFLTGTPLPSRAAATTLRELGDLLARVDLALAGWARPVPPRDLQWDLRTVHNARRLLVTLADPALVERAIHRYESLAAPVLGTLSEQVIHNDANPYNILVGDSGHLTALIDFGDVVRAPAVQELATACAYQIHDDNDPLHDAAVLVAAYHARRPLSDEEFAILPALIGARNALTVLVSASSARNAPDNSAYLTRNTSNAWEGLRSLHRIAPSAAAEQLRDAAARAEKNMP